VFFVLKLFKGNKHFTVYKSKSFSDVDTKAKQLSEFLNVPYNSKTS